MLSFHTFRFFFSSLLTDYSIASIAAPT